MRILHPSLAGLFLFLCVAQAGAAAAATYVVVSMVGSQLTIVVAEQVTGSRTDKNHYDVRPLSDPILDATALTAAKATIEKARPRASVVTLRVKDPKLLALQDTWFGKDTIAAPELLELLKGEIGDDPTTRLILISSHRAEPHLETTRGSVGTGHVSGLGFYVDSFTFGSRSDTGEQGWGFFAPFASLRMALVDPRSLAIESEEFVAAGSAYSPVQGNDRDPWHAMSNEQKIRMLQNLLTDEIVQTTQMLLSKQRQ
jgi:hypothetical protein